MVDYPPLPHGSTLVVRAHAGHPKVVLARRFSCSPPLAYGFHNNCLDVVLQSVMERLFFVKNDAGAFVPPPATGPLAWAVVRAAARELAEQIGRRSPMTYEEFVRACRASKRRLYGEAVVSLLAKPVCEEDSFVSAFRKSEKTNFSAKPEAVARLISPRSPRYNVEVGRFLKPIEHAVYHGLDELFARRCRTKGVPVTVAKGLNFKQRAVILRRKWTRFRKPVAISFDASRWDQHTRQEALTTEHMVYNLIYRSKELAQLLRWQLHTRMKISTPDGRIKVDMPACRCSGDMNTSLGNVLLMCLLMSCCLAEIGVEYEFTDDGDDCVIICEEEDRDAVLAHVPAWFFARGYTLRLEGVASVFEKIAFCQTQPVFDGEEWTMIRDPRVALAKDSVFTGPLNGKYPLQYMAAVAQCGEAIAGGMPVWNAFYQRWAQLSIGVKPSHAPELDTGMLQNSRGMRRYFGKVSDAARESFWKAFDIQPAAQLVMEQLFEKWTEGPEMALAQPPQHPGYLQECCAVVVV